MTQHRSGPSGAGNVLEVTLDRPKANAIDLATSRIMGEVFTEFRDDPESARRIITGGGRKVLLPRLGPEGRRRWRRGRRRLRQGRLRRAAGAARPEQAGDRGGERDRCGGGLELALSADIILAADHATFALPEIRSGTVADAASIKLPKRIPYHIAMELLLTGRWFDVEEAARWGLVNRIVPAGDLMDEARKMADDLAAGPPLVFAAIKEIVREAEDMKFQDALNRITGSQFETVERLYRSEDQLEGARAFAEGRDPVWKGK
jgi:crotonobetainyl-CoA hydratase